MTQAIQTIERRVNELGVSEPVVAPYGTTGDQIIVSCPGCPTSRARRTSSADRAARVQLVEAGPAPDQATLLQRQRRQVPRDMEVVPGAGHRATRRAPSTSCGRSPAVTGRDLRNARPTLDEYNTPAVSFTLNSEGVVKFSRVTAANVGRQLAIVLDNQVVSAPRIEGADRAPRRASPAGSRSRRRTTWRSCCGRARCRRR